MENNETTFTGTHFADVNYAERFDFGLALTALEAGARVAREGWNGKDMWLALVDCAVDNGDFTSGTAYNMRGPHEARIEELEQLPWIGMKTADSKFVPWLASQTDVLAKDWIIVV